MDHTELSTGFKNDLLDKTDQSEDKSGKCLIVTLEIGTIKKNKASEYKFIETVISIKAYGVVISVTDKELTGKIKEITNFDVNIQETGMKE